MLSKHVIVSRRIIKYLNKYETVLVFAALITSFPATMLLTRSKLFYFNIFYFPLTKEEFERAIMFRVINVTFLEVSLFFCFFVFFGYNVVWCYMVIQYEHYI